MWDKINYYKELLGVPKPITCQSCGQVVNMTKRDILCNCLYQESDWTKCLCIDCTHDWLRQKEMNNK